jgi:hypothetical protein
MGIGDGGKRSERQMSIEGSKFSSIFQYYSMNFEDGQEII